ncbi:MAG: DUF4124 domain-containing protein [Desulfobacterales bacterium]
MKIASDESQRSGRVLIRTIVAALCGVATAALALENAQAQGIIYHWTDDNGVRHFTNVRPSKERIPKATAVAEIPYDAEADEERAVRERQWRREQEREAMRQRLLRTEVQLKETERLAEAAADRIDALESRIETLGDEAESARYRVVYPYHYWKSHKRFAPKFGHEAWKSKSRFDTIHGRSKPGGSNRRRHFDNEFRTSRIHRRW